MKFHAYDGNGLHDFNSGAFMFGAGIGFDKNKWDIGLRYHAAKINESYDLFDFAEFRIGYTLWSK